MYAIVYKSQKHFGGVFNDARHSEKIAHVQRRKLVIAEGSLALDTLAKPPFPMRVDQTSSMMHSLVHEHGAAASSFQEYYRIQCDLRHGYLVTYHVAIEAPVRRSVPGAPAAGSRSAATLTHLHRCPKSQVRSLVPSAGTRRRRHEDLIV